MAKVLDMGVPIIKDISDVLNDCDGIESWISGDRISSGAGFGYRDMQFRLKEWVDVEDLLERVRSALADKGYPIKGYESVYLSVYDEEENEEE